MSRDARYEIPYVDVGFTATPNPWVILADVKRGFLDCITRELLPHRVFQRFTRVHGDLAAPTRSRVALAKGSMAEAAPK